jgi:hypothetical protein
MSIQKGFPSKEREVSRDLPYKSDHITAQPVREKQIANDVISHQFVYAAGTDTCEADCTTTVLNLTAHSILVGDIVRFTSGNLSGQEVKVIGTTTNTVELGEILSEAPSTDDIQILRHKYPLVTSSGALSISTTSATEDSPASSGDDVTAIASVRQDSLSGDTSTDGDYAFVKSNSKGEVYIHDVDANAALSAIQTAVEILDNIVSGNEAQVDVVSSTLPTGAATAANQSTANSSLSTIEGDTTSLDSKVTACDTDDVTISASALPTGAATDATLSSIITEVSKLDIVDQIDTTPLLDTSSTNITASSGNPVEIVSSLAADVKKITIVEDIGSFIGIYTGAALSETLKAVLPLGGGELDLQIASGTRISLRAMENTAISSGKIAINFQG